jgi:hypothetical protein
VHGLSQPFTNAPEMDVIHAKKLKATTLKQHLTPEALLMIIAQLAI